MLLTGIRQQSSIATATFWIKIIVLAVVAAALLMRLAFMWISISHLPATSDEASLALLAKMISRGELPLLFIGQPYQFPIESYLMAPFIDWLPRNALGVRYQMLTLGLLSLFGYCAILRHAYPQGRRWPALIIVLFPSAYLLMTTSGYAPPQYSMALTLAWFSIFATLHARTDTAHRVWYFFAGLACGLGISNHLLTITVSIGVFALIFCDGSLKQGLKNVAIAVSGCAVGVLPYILAVLTIPGAYKNLPASLPLAKAFTNLWNPALSDVLAGTMGINPVLFPDFRVHLGWPEELRTVFAILYVLLVVILTAIRFREVVACAQQRRWPHFQLVDLALLTSMATIYIFTSHRASGGAYRYLLPAVWCFPFLVGHAYQTSNRRIRTVIGATAVVLATFNFATSLDMITKWHEPGKVEEYADTPSIDQLLDVLAKRDISYCYATFWLAYRITYESDEQIICALPFNERFPLWPIPYKKQVDEQNNSAYVLTQTFSARLTILGFEHDLGTYGISAKREKIGHFLVYNDFHYTDQSAESGHTLATSNYFLQTSAPETGSLRQLQDHDFNTLWRSGASQYNGQWLRLKLAKTETVTGVTLFHPPNSPLAPYSLTVKGALEANGKEEWIHLAGPTKATMERLRFVNNHPVYLGFSQQFHFQPHQLDALEVAIIEPSSENKWQLAEIEVNVSGSDN